MICVCVGLFVFYVNRKGVGLLSFLRSFAKNLP